MADSRRTPARRRRELGLPRLQDGSDAVCSPTDAIAHSDSIRITCSGGLDRLAERPISEVGKGSCLAVLSPLLSRMARAARRNAAAPLPIADGV